MVCQMKTGVIGLPGRMHEMDGIDTVRADVFIRGERPGLNWNIRQVG